MQLPFRKTRGPLRLICSVPDSIFPNIIMRFWFYAYVQFSPNITLCGWLGSKHQLTIMRRAFMKCLVVSDVIPLCKPLLFCYAGYALYNWLFFIFSRYAKSVQCSISNNSIRMNTCHAGAGVAPRHPENSHGVRQGDVWTAGGGQGRLRQGLPQDLWKGTDGKKELH